MEYEIRLSGTPFDDGAIDFDRLELPAQYLHDITNLSLTDARDTYFSRPVRRETVVQQIERQLQKKGPKNPLKTFIGILADAEGSFEDDLKMLSE